MFLIFLNYFNILISKIIFKKLKNIIDMYFNIKNYFKKNHNYTKKNVVGCFPCRGPPRHDIFIYALPFLQCETNNNHINFKTSRGIEAPQKVMITTVPNLFSSKKKKESFRYRK